MPLITRPQVYRVVRELLPRERFGPEELLLWLDGVQQRNERASAGRPLAPVDGVASRGRIEGGIQAQSGGVPFREDAAPLADCPPRHQITSIPP